jgi:hypothetical protein
MPYCRMGGLGMFCAKHWSAQAVRLIIPYEPQL